ncbi:MAG: hypothetical protein K0R47_3986 [Brevibacillus sp.]|nr:hypothetical protein [Brevibacillus sp.]
MGGCTALAHYNLNNPPKIGYTYGDLLMKGVTAWIAMLKS